jgi:hypothetical protein
LVFATDLIVLAACSGLLVFGQLRLDKYVLVLPHMGGWMHVCIRGNAVNVPFDVAAFLQDLPMLFPRDLSLL